MAETIITADNFENEVLNSDKTVLVDFWASWCGPCMMLSPIVAEIAEEFPDIKVGKLNIDDHMDLALKYNVVSIPTIMLFQNGEVKKTLVGFRGKEELIEELGLGK